MPTKQLWINLPVKDVHKSMAFFEAIGFKLNAQFPNGDNGASFFIGDNNLVMMLFPTEMFKSFTQNTVTDTTKSTEILLSIDAESREEVDALAQKAKDAGATLFSPPAESHRTMYGCAFADLDGHRWNVLFMG